MNNDAKARAAVFFKTTSPEGRSAAMAAYRAEKEAAIDRMAQQRAARLARAHQAASGSREG
jgi:hypothetical protein